MLSCPFCYVAFLIQARQFIGKTFAVTSLVIVVIMCSLFNVPRFFREDIMCHEYIEGADTFSNNSLTVSSSNSTVDTLTKRPVIIYFSMPSRLGRNETFTCIYRWTYFVLGMLVPLFVLIFCNVQLIRSLRRSVVMRLESNSARHNGNAANRITLTLIVIVVMYIILCVPCELVNFFTKSATAHTTDIYNLIVTIFNLCQAINFAVNFVLYCAINTHFRHTIYRLLHCSRRRLARGGQVEGGGTFRSSVNTSHAISLKKRYGTVAEVSTYV